MKKTAKQVLEERLAKTNVHTTHDIIHIVSEIEDNQETYADRLFVVVLYRDLLLEGRRLAIRGQAFTYQSDDYKDYEWMQDELNSLDI